MFEMWSVWHYLYIFSPIIILIPLYFILRRKSDKVKYIIGIILGTISILILLARNIDILINEGWNAEVIPLQVCHFGNIIAGLGLITKRKWLILTAFCFNLIPAFSSLIVADALLGYATLWAIKPQAYIWGHLFIIICSMYGVMFYKNKFNYKDALKSIICVLLLLVTAIICNSAFREFLGWTPNYFYIFNSEGVPFEFIYNAGKVFKYGWFQINWFYTLALISIFALGYYGLYWLAKLISKEKSKGIKIKTKKLRHSRI